MTLTIKGKNSVLEALSSFVEGDMLDGENAYFCEGCNKKVDTLKRTCIKVLPNVFTSSFFFLWEASIFSPYAILNLLKGPNLFSIFLTVYDFLGSPSASEAIWLRFRYDEKWKGQRLLRISSWSWHGAVYSRRACEKREREKECRKLECERFCKCGRRRRRGILSSKARRGTRPSHFPTRILWIWIAWCFGA